jgi:hypothetical protein
VQPFDLESSKLGGRQVSIKVDCYDWDAGSAHDLIGTCNFTLDEVVASGGTKDLALVNPEKAKKKSHYTNSGLLKVKLALVPTPSFLDYLANGCELGLIAGVDFTGSNGIPTDPQSLHYINPQVKNEYQMALEMGECERDRRNDIVAVLNSKRMLMSLIPFSSQSATSWFLTISTAWFLRMDLVLSCLMVQCTLTFISRFSPIRSLLASTA